MLHWLSSARRVLVHYKAVEHADLDQKPENVFLYTFLDFILSS